MEFLGNIVKLFSHNYQIALASEDFTLARIICQTNNITIPDIVILKDAIEYIRKPDSLSIYIKISENEADIFSSTNSNYCEFLQELGTSLSQKEEGEIIYITIEINKKKANEFLSVYSINLFSTYLGELSLQQTLSIFTSSLTFTNNLVFRCFGIAETFETSSISFIPFSGDNYTTRQIIDRTERIAIIYSSIHSSSSFKPLLLPEEFIFITSSQAPTKIANVFSRCAFALLVLSLFDLIQIVDDEISYKLNGYKTIEGKYVSGDVTSSYSELALIYHWVYNSGNLVDKLGLARNILSLHLEDSNKLIIKGNPYQSILSSYQVYQKQNIKQYIEVRNKISDQLVDFNKRATSIVDSFANGYQKSALTLVTFFSTLIAIRFLTASNLSLTFSLNAFIISCVFLLVSLIYLIILRLETREQKKRFERSYINMKSRYTDLLNSGDIQKILNNDIDHQDDEKFISDKLKWYTAAWGTTLGLIFFATCILFISGAYETIKKMVDIFIFGYIKSLK